MSEYFNDTGILVLGYEIEVGDVLFVKEVEMEERIIIDINELLEEIK